MRTKLTAADSTVHPQTSVDMYRLMVKFSIILNKTSNKKAKKDLQIHMHKQANLPQDKQPQPRCWKSLSLLVVHYNWKE